MGGDNCLQPFLIPTSPYSDTGRQTKPVCPWGNLFSKSTVSNGRRSVTSWSWMNVKFSNFDGICGINGVFTGNVDFQMRYDWDPNKGFHVNAIKGNEVRAFIFRVNSRARMLGWIGI